MARTHRPFTQLAALATLALAAAPALAQERTLKIYGFGAKSGVVRIFGLNSEASIAIRRSVARRCRPRLSRRSHEHT